MEASRRLIAVPCDAAMIFIVALILATASAAAAEFSPDAWRQAVVDPAKRYWSREAMIRDFATVVPESKLIGMTRAEIIALLGEPGLSERSYYFGTGPKGRIDLYRLSAANNHSFRLDYGEDDNVRSVLLESSPCICELCNSESMVTRATLEGTVLTASPTPQPASSMAQIEKLVGATGKADVTQNSVGGQLWANYSEVWRLSDDPNGYFIASGHIVARNWKSLAESPAYSLALVSAWPNCLAP